MGGSQSLCGLFMDIKKICAVYVQEEKQMDVFRGSKGACRHLTPKYSLFGVIAPFCAQAQYALWPW